MNTQQPHSPARGWEQEKGVLFKSDILLRFPALRKAVRAYKNVDPDSPTADYDLEVAADNLGDAIGNFLDFVPTLIIAILTIPMDYTPELIEENEQAQPSSVLFTWMWEVLAT